MGLAETADLPLSREGENIVLWTPRVCAAPGTEHFSLSRFHPCQKGSFTPAVPTSLAFSHCEPYRNH